ncbi:OmpA family protein [Aeromicrobium sp. NPDC092404]|uniref:OmpA family protein n=1 Tax=Aeromicrobium sp. NPDC092404 TaxID=3154976 RepID=UPI00342BF8FC
MSEQRLRGLAALLGTTLLAVVAVGALVGSSSAASDLQGKAERALASAGLDEIRVTFEGREAELSGGTVDDLGQAELVVEGIEGVRRADVVRPAGGAPAEAADTTPTLRVSRTGAGITISGTVPDADGAVGIKAGVAEAFAVPVTGDLAIDPAVGPAPWTDELTHAFVDLVGIKDLELEIDGSGTLDLGGSIESRSGVEDARRLVAAAVPELDVVNRLSVRRAGLSEADATVLISSTLYFGRDSSDLSAANRGILDDVAAVLRRNVGVTIEAGGYAGPDDPSEGEVLSLARVAAVKAYLVRSGVSPARVSTRTFASHRQTADVASRQFRRVEFVVNES